MYGHGSYELTVNNRVLIAKIIGAWNKEEGEQYFRELKQVTQDIIHEPWAMVIYLDQWELGTPGSDEVTLQLIQWLSKNKLAMTAEVYSPQLLKKLHVERLVNNANFEIDRQCFTDDQEAFDWLASQGFPINSKK